MVAQARKSDYENVGKTMSVISGEIECAKRAKLVTN